MIPVTVECLETRDAFAARELLPITDIRLTRHMHHTSTSSLAALQH